jgi:hypothetical protein
MLLLGTFMFVMFRADRLAGKLSSRRWPHGELGRAK